MISRYKYKKITWIDLESPTQEEVRALMKEFGIHPLVAEELRSPTLRPKVDLYDNFIYLILHFPAFQHTHGHNPEQEVDFVIGKDFIITTHYTMIDTLHEFSKVFEVNSIIDKSHIGNHAGFVFFYIAKELYKSLAQELEYVNAALEKVEEDIFKGKERAMVEKISKINRNLLNFKQSIRLHQDVLSSLEMVGSRFFGEKFSYYLSAISGEYFKIASHLEGNRETVLELRNTNDSLLSTKQNEVMKILTIMAFVTFPLSLIAAIFGMNTVYIPIIGTPGDFWIVMGIMGFATFLMFLYFKRKKWI